MYTRFKSSKNGIKLGLTTVTNTARTRVSVASTTSTTGLKNLQNGKENKNILDDNKDSNNNSTVNVEEIELSNIPFIQNRLYSSLFDDDKIDETYVNYVKDTWKNCENKIDKPNGPVRYVDLNNNHEHLKNFIAFDMESWWADRAYQACITNNTVACTKPQQPKQQPKNCNTFQHFIDTNRGVRTTTNNIICF